MYYYQLFLVFGFVLGQFPGTYKAQADLLIRTAQKNIDFANFEYLCDTFGPRYRGTPGLDNALEWMVNTMKSQGLENVVKEPVPNVTNWVRGVESLTMLEPRYATLGLLGLGLSVGGIITSEAIVVTSFDDLKNKSAQVKGKIVVFNAPFISYGQTVIYRVIGASEAAKFGAVAALVRTVGSFSLYTPHTGGMVYEPNIKQIPTACITIEDSDMLARMSARGQKILLSLKMSAHIGTPVNTYNILAEVVGRESPEQIVLIGGHSDSWDVGQGAIDDGGGLFSAWEAVRTIHNLVASGQLQRPRRTIRLVLWVDEELNQAGAATYLKDHLNDLNNHVIAIESDSGNFSPVGFGFTGVPAAKVIMNQIGTLLSQIGAGNITDGGADTDNGFLVRAGVPGGSLISGGFDNNDQYYFWFHHSNADMITHINRDGFRNSAAAFSVMSYVLADMQQRLPNK